MTGINTRTGRRNVQRSANYVPTVKPKEERGRSTITVRYDNPKAQRDYRPTPMQQQFGQNNTATNQPNSLDTYAWLGQQYQQQSGQAMQQALSGYQQTSQVTLANQKDMELFRNNQNLLQQQQASALGAGGNPTFTNKYDPKYGFDDRVQTSTWSTVIPGQRTGNEQAEFLQKMQNDALQHQGANQRAMEDGRNRAQTEQARLGAEASMFGSMMAGLNNQGFRYW
jgi:hypothetical protein